MLSIFMYLYLSWFLLISILSKTDLIKEYCELSTRRPLALIKPEVKYEDYHKPTLGQFGPNCH